MELGNLLEIYIIIIFLCLIVDITYLFYKKNYEKKLVLRKKYWNSIFIDLEKKKNYVLSKNDMKKIKNTTWASAFIEEYNCCIKNNPKLKKIIIKNRDEFIQLFSSNILKSHKVFFLNILCDLKPSKDAKFINHLTKEIANCSLYMKVSIISLLFDAKDAKLISDIFKKLSIKNSNINSRIISEFIDKYEGNKRTLANELYANYKKFTNQYKEVFVYLLKKINNHKYDKFLIENFDNEIINLQLLIIDLISLKNNSMNKNFLLKLSKYENNKILEKCAISLSNFDDDKVKSRLFELTDNIDYNIKNNSIKSLIVLNVDYKEFSKRIVDKQSRQIFKNIIDSNRKATNND